MVERLDVEKLLADFPTEFQSKAYYSPNSDAVKFFRENVDCHAERIDCWLTLYRAFGDNRVVGFKIKNVKVLLSKFDALGFDYKVSDTQWAIRIQAVIAYIPMTISEAAPQYRDVLTSFAHHLHDPVDLACSPA